MRECSICGEKFAPKQKTQKFCSRKCYIRHHNKKYQESHKEELKARKKKWYELNQEKCKRNAMINYLRNRKEIREKNRKRGIETRRKTRMQVLIHYGGNPPKCNCCGESHLEFLCIDHKHGGGVKHRKMIKLKAGNRFYRWLVKNNFPKGFQVLCHNCNMSRGFYGYCPHQLDQKKGGFSGQFN